MSKQKLGLISQINAVFVIASATARQASRARLNLILITFILALLGFTGLISEASVGQTERLVKDSGLFLISFSRFDQSLLLENPSTRIIHKNS